MSSEEEQEVLPFWESIESALFIVVHLLKFSRNYRYFIRIEYIKALRPG